jgi:hypothetical protein
MSLHKILDDEFKRVAKLEDISMEQLVSDVAATTSYTPRQIYNFRSGKWPLPSELIPYFCMRFKSRALLYGLIGLCERTPVEIPDSYDLAVLSTRIVREDLRHYENLLLAYEDKKITSAELGQLEESGQRVISNICMTLSMARAEHERQTQAGENTSTSEL